MPYIPQTVYANLPQTTVISGGTTAPTAGTSETWTVTSSASFPAIEFGAQQCHISDPAANSELITITNISGTIWTVTRGAEGTLPVSHIAGFTVVQVVSAGDLASLQYPPWQFAVQQYGAQGDGKIGTGGTGTSGTATFTDSGASFVNAAAPAGDVGKVIVINQGAANGTSNPFCGTILAVNSGTSVTLSANLGANCTNAPYIYGTDDTSAINSAITAAAGWAVSTGNYKAQVIFQPANYMLGGLTQTTAFNWSFNSGPYTYNAQIPLPFTGQFARKMVLDLIGVGDASEPDFWGSTIPSLSGTCLVSAVFGTGQPDATFGQMSVIGAPSAQTNIGTGGISGGGFANALYNIQGLTVVAPWNSQQFGYDFRFAAQANIPNASYLAFAPVNASGASVGGPYLSATNIVSNGISAGCAMPLCQNNDNCNLNVFSVEGAAIGLIMSEHTTAQRLATIYCSVGIEPSWQLNGTTEHGGAILYWSCEACQGGILTNASVSHTYPLFIGNADFEVISSYYLNDGGWNLTGTMYWYDITPATPGAGPGIIGAANYSIINCRLGMGPWAGAPAAPASTVTQQNSSYRYATIYASASTSITNTSVGPASGTQTALGQTSLGATDAVPVRVPPGHWYSVTYTGTLTTKWVLD